MLSASRGRGGLVKNEDDKPYVLGALPREAGPPAEHDGPVGQRGRGSHAQEPSYDQVLRNSTFRNLSIVHS